MPRGGDEVVEVDEPPGWGTGVSVDGLVVVADAEDAQCRARHEAQEEHVRRGEILELVDEEELAAALGVASDLGLGEEHLKAAVDLLVEVHRAAPRELVAIAREDLREALDVASELVLHDPRASKSQPDARQCVDPRGCWVRVRPALKLAVQVAAAGFVVLGGVVFPVTPWFLPNVALSMFWIVMITNAFNLIDNMDGLCAGVVIVICLFRSWLLTSEGYRADAHLWAILAAAFAGFLFFNYHPARIFMGDCGSLPAGFALGALTLAGPAPHKGLLLTGFFYPALTFAYPIFDTALVSVLRKLTGRPISLGGRDHSSHRLASLGLDQRQVVWILWLLTAFGASLGIMIHLMPDALFAVS